MTTRYQTGHEGENGYKILTCEDCGKEGVEHASPWACQTCGRVRCEDCGGDTQGDGKCDDCRATSAAAAALGRRGGKVGGRSKSPAKRAAVRENGKKGGRPKSFDAALKEFRTLGGGMYHFTSPHGSNLTHWAAGTYEEVLEAVHGRPVREATIAALKAGGFTDEQVEKEMEGWED